ncbi:MAG TPA: type II/IV secretion system protein [Candidatus Wolfebacteria bacterium]|nr:type II/IV secretion system protein [Candidatus Wolfebacteria bacterium]
MFMINNIKEKLAQMRRGAEERAAQRRAQKSNYEYINLTISPVNIKALGLIAEETAKKIKVAAIEAKKKKMALAVFDPNTLETKKIIKDFESKGYQVSIFVVSLIGLKYAWSFYKFVFKKSTQITGKVEIEEEKLAKLKEVLTSLESIKISFEKADKEGIKTAEIFEVILAGALANRASDIHFEPGEEQVKLRLRIDGLLHDVFSKFKKHDYLYLVSRIKLLSRLKLNIHNEPQDGRFTIALPDKDIEIRTSILPSEYGETIVLRILDPESIQVGLKELGFRSDDLEIIEKELGRPNGMILNTGPTGSGKTTTLYAFLKHTQKSEIKTITIEDPIEYHLEGVEQTQVDPETGYTFAGGLRSILRQDPDMILVGEIRDLETAEIAMHAALTGHLVFSTLHTNQASGAVPRLIDIGVKPSIIAPALNLIIAQRLVRQLCQDCKISQKVDKELEKKIKRFIEKLPDKIDKNKYKEIKIFQSKGCDKCSDLGYKGRIGIFEFLLMDKELEKIIAQEVVGSEIKKIAVASGMITIQQDGILKVVSGLTTFEEIKRTTGLIEW